VIGVLSFKLKQAEGLSFAVPANYARGLLASQDSLTLEQFAMKTQETVDLFSKAVDVSAFPPRWKSNVTGLVYLLRTGERTSIVRLSPRRPEALGWIRDGRQPESGRPLRWTRHRSLRLSVRHRCFADLLGREPRINMCSDVFAAELTLVSPSRIEGWDEWYPEGTRLDCKKCAWDPKAQR
jgi:hypothetical protein